MEKITWENVDENMDLAVWELLYKLENNLEGFPWVVESANGDEIKITRVTEKKNFGDTSELMSEDELALAEDDVDPTVEYLNKLIDCGFVEG